MSQPVDRLVPPGNTPRPGKRVVVVGGGVAGMSVALELAHRNFDVLLVEAGAVLGGKVSGSRDAVGAPLEHGMHGWWSDYANFLELLQQYGVGQVFSEHVERLNVIHRNGDQDALSFSELPSPFHNLSMVMGLKTVNLRGKLSALRGGMGVVQFDPDLDLRELDTIDFRTWMHKQGVSQSAAAVLYEPTMRSNLFLPLEQLSAYSGVNALLRGLRHTDSWKFRWLRGNPNDLIWRPLGRSFQEAGGVLRLSSHVRGIEVSARVTSVRIESPDGKIETVPADHVVVAVDVEACKAIIAGSGSPICDQLYFRNIFNLSATDVAVARTWFRGTSLIEVDHAALIGFETVDAVINLSKLHPELGHEGMLVLETQAYLGNALVEAPEDVIASLVLHDLRSALPGLKEFEYVKSTVMKHKGLFTAHRVGEESSRPSVVSPIAGLYLAGDWVRSPEHVMFMENAVLTGRRAAAHIAEECGVEGPKLASYAEEDITLRVMRKGLRALASASRFVRHKLGVIRINEPIEFRS